MFSAIYLTYTKKPMNFFSSTAWGPISTPKVLKWLIIITCSIAIMSTALQDIFDLLGIFPGPQSILSLSLWGLKNGFIWQPLTFLFVQESAGLSLSFFFMLLLNMYVLWVVGGNLIEVIGKSSFLRLYFIGSIIAGAFALLIMQITGYHEIISGLIPALLIITTVWVMAFPETEILLFFLIPFKAKWVVAFVIGALCIINLFHLEFSLLSLYLAAIVIGYGYAAICHGWSSPFPITKKLDIWLAESGLKMRRNTPQWMHAEKFKKTKDDDKVIDITNAQPLSDDNSFVDAMLSKISKNGENSLTWSERTRLQKISEKKNQNKR